MKSVFVIITVLVAVLHARFVHTRSATRNPRKAGHTSEVRRSHSALMNSKAQLTGVPENLPVSASGLHETDMVHNSVNGEQSYVLVPLQDLMRDRRASQARNSGDDQDPLYVMFPYQEIVRKARDFDDAPGSNITTLIKSENLLSNNSNFGGSQDRKRRGISSQAKWLLKSRKVANRRPHALSVRRERMSQNELADMDYDDALHGEPPKNHIRLSSNGFSGDQSAKKTKTSLYLNELKSQLHPEMFEGLHQKPRVLTDFSDLSPKIMQTVIGIPKKSSVNPINITMFISNLIPPNEVENTRITNAGKLYKSGCLKFSIQLERPGACSCSQDDSSADDVNGKSTICPPVVTQKVAFVHPGTADDKSKSAGKPAEVTSSSPGSCGQLPVSAKAQSGTVDSADTAKIEPAALTKDVSTLLLQLIGAEKKLPKKPAATPGQTIVMDNEVIKELQRLFANHVASKSSDSAGKSVGATPAPAAPIAPNSPKARAIAEALNLFSKYSSLKQVSQ